MDQFVFDGRGKDARTGHERIAMRNIRHAINWIVGGYYNCIQDHTPEYLPESREALEQADVVVYNSDGSVVAPAAEAAGNSTSATGAGAASATPATGAGTGANTGAPAAA